MRLTVPDAYARTETLPEVVVFSALFLLARLKERFPAARGSSRHRLFISAFMIASKVICNDTYSNKSWRIVGQNLYTLKEVNQMEREMCSYLEWLLHVEAPELEAFTQRVKKEYGPDCGPNPPRWSPPHCSRPSRRSSTRHPRRIGGFSPGCNHPDPVLPIPYIPPPTHSCSNQSSLETSDEECLTAPSGGDQVGIAHPSTAHSMMNSGTTLKAKAITSTSHSVNLTDPSFAFAGRQYGSFHALGIPGRLAE